MNQKGFAVLPIIIIALAVGGVISFYYFKPNLFSQSSQVAQINDQSNTSTSYESSASSQAKENKTEFKTYVNTNQHYSFEYPSDWFLKECSIGKEPEYTNVNIYLDRNEIKDCNGFPGTRISLFPIYNQTLDQVNNDSKKQQEKIMELTLEKKIMINGRNAIQTAGKLKVTPPLPLPFTSGTSTMIEIPENNQILLIGLTGELTDDLESAAYLKILDTLKPLN